MGDEPQDGEGGGEAEGTAQTEGGWRCVRRVADRPPRRAALTGTRPLASPPRPSAASREPWRPAPVSRAVRAPGSLCRAAQ